MTDRETVRAELAYNIVAGVVKSAFTPDVSKLDADDVRLALFGFSSLEAMEARERVTARAAEMAASWLESDPRGAQMLDEAMEEEREFRRDLAKLNVGEGAAA